MEFRQRGAILVLFSPRHSAHAPPTSGSSAKARTPIERCIVIYKPRTLEQEHVFELKAGAETIGAGSARLSALG